MEANTQQIQTPVNPVPVTPSPIKPKPPILVIMLGIVVFLLVLATGFLFMQNTQLQNEIAGLKASSSYMEVSPTPVATTDPMAGWKTYQGANFSFMYPLDWKEETDGKSYVRASSLKTVDLPGVTTSSPISEAQIEVQIVDLGKTILLSDLQSYTDSTDTLQIDSKVETELVGNSAISYEAKEVGPSENNIKGINVITNNGFLRIKLRDYTDLYSNTALFDQILSTFKFTN